MKPTDYPIFLIYSEEDQAWLGKVDQLPGCIVDGETPEEALSKAKSAIEAWVGTSTDLRRTIPEALTLEKLELIVAKNNAKQQELFQAALRNVAEEVLHQFNKAKVHAFSASSQSLGSGVRGMMAGASGIGGIIDSQPLFAKA